MRLKDCCASFAMRMRVLTRGPDGELVLRTQLTFPDGDGYSFHLSGTPPVAFACRTRASPPFTSAVRTTSAHSWRERNGCYSSNSGVRLVSTKSAVSTLSTRFLRSCR